MYAITDNIIGDMPSKLKRRRISTTADGGYLVHSTADAQYFDEESYGIPISPDDQEQSFTPSPAPPSRFPEQSEEHRSHTGGSANQKSAIQQLYNSPVLFDPVRRPRHPIVLCHGAPNSRQICLTTYSP